MLTSTVAPHLTNACSQQSDIGEPEASPLTGSPVPIEQRIANLETRLTTLEINIKNFALEISHRVAHVESEQNRFTTALISAGEFLFKNPASKMMLAAFPKEMQTKLKEFFDGTQTGR
jgi:hypothetical protein